MAVVFPERERKVVLAFVAQQDRGFFHADVAAQQFPRTSLPLGIQPIARTLMQRLVKVPFQSRDGGVAIRCQGGDTPERARCTFRPVRDLHHCLAHRFPFPFQSNDRVRTHPSAET